MQLDVEQQELAILRVWPFHRYCVRVFNIENEPPKGEAKFLVLYRDKSDTMQAGVPRIHLCFRAEDPFIFRDRVVAAQDFMMLNLPRHPFHDAAGAFPGQRDRSQVAVAAAVPGKQLV